jgi:hypothetical protein
MSDRVERLRAAFEKGKAGDRRGAMDDFRSDYVHHSNLLGDIHGLDAYFENWLPIFESINLVQEVQEITEQPPFVVVAVRQTSSIKPDPTTTLHIYRWEGDQVAEMWTLVDTS